jgi:hypothetical protein
MARADAECPELEIFLFVLAHFSELNRGAERYERRLLDRRMCGSPVERPRAHPEHHGHDDDADPVPDFQCLPSCVSLFLPEEKETRDERHEPDDDGRNTHGPADPEPWRQEPPRNDDGEREIAHGGERSNKPQAPPGLLELGCPRVRHWTPSSPHVQVDGFARKRHDGEAGVVELPHPDWRRDLRRVPPDGTVQATRRDLGHDDHLRRGVYLDWPAYPRLRTCPIESWRCRRQSRAAARACVEGVSMSIAGDRGGGGRAGESAGG